MADQLPWLLESWCGVSLRRRLAGAKCRASGRGLRGGARLGVATRGRVGVFATVDAEGCNSM